MELEIEINREFNDALKSYRDCLRGKNSEFINAMLADESCVGSYWVSKNQDRAINELLYKARLRALAQALTEHPLATLHGDAILFLESIGDDTTAMQDLQVKLLADSFFDSLENPDVV